MNTTANAPSRAEFLTDARLAETLRVFFVCRGVKECDADDLVQETRTIAWKARGCPDDKDGVRRYAYGVAGKVLLAYWRRSDKEAQRHAGVSGDAMGQDNGALLGRDLIRRLRRVLPKGKGHERALRTMVKSAQGEELNAIAVDEGVSAKQLSVERSKLRAFLTAHRGELVSMTLFMIVLLIIDLRATPTTDVADTIHPDRTDLPKLRPHPPNAAELRRMAAAAYEQGRLQVCLDELDAARALDEPGDEAPDVQRLRGKCRGGEIEAPHDDPVPENDKPTVKDLKPHLHQP